MSTAGHEITRQLLAAIGFVVTTMTGFPSHPPGGPCNLGFSYCNLSIEASSCCLPQAPNTTEDWGWGPDATRVRTHSQLALSFRQRLCSLFPPCRLLPHVPASTFPCWLWSSTEPLHELLPHRVGCLDTCSGFYCHYLCHVLSVPNYKWAIAAVLG